MSELVDKASLEHARALYFQFYSVEKIAEETGISKRELRLYIYGERGHLSPSVGSWYYERGLSNAEEFVELSQRNKLLAHKFTALAIHEAYESLKILKDKVDKKGRKVAFTPFDMEKLFGIITQLDKMQRLSQGLPTDIFHLDMPQGGGEIGEDESDVLDMHALAETIASDKGLMKLIKGAIDEKGTQSESGDSRGSSEVGHGFSGSGSGGDGRSSVGRGQDEQGGLVSAQDRGARAAVTPTEKPGKGATSRDPETQGRADSPGDTGGDQESISSRAVNSVDPGLETRPSEQAKHELHDEPSSHPSDSESNGAETRSSGDGKGRSTNRARKPRERQRSEEISETELGRDWSDSEPLADEYEPL